MNADDMMALAPQHAGQPPALELRTENVPLPRTKADLFALIRTIFAKPFVEELHIKFGEPIKVVWSAAPGDALTAESPDLSPADTLLRSNIVEMPEHAASSFEDVFEAQQFLSQQGCYPCYLVVHSIADCKNFFGLNWRYSFSRMPGVPTAYTACGLQIVPAADAVALGTVVVLAGAVLAGRMMDMTDGVIITR